MLQRASNRDNRGQCRVSRLTLLPCLFPLGINLDPNWFQIAGKHSVNFVVHFFLNQQKALVKRWWHTPKCADTLGNKQWKHKHYCFWSIHKLNTLSCFTLKRSGKYCQLWGGQNSALHKGVFFYCSWNIAWLKNCNTQKFPVKGLNDGLKHWTLRSWCYKWKKTCPSTWSQCDLEVHQLSTLHHQLHLVCKELLAHLGYSGKGGGGGGWGQLVELLAVRGLSSGWQGLGWGTPGQQVSLMVGGSEAQVWAGVPLNCELRQGLSSRYESSCLGLFCGAVPWLHNQGLFCMSRWWHLLAVLGRLLPQAPPLCLLGGLLGVETPALMGARPPWQGEVLAEHNKSEVFYLLYVYVLKCLEKRGTADIFLCLHHRSTKSLETSFDSSLRDSLHQEQSWVAGEMMKRHHPVWPPRKIQRMALLTWRSAKDTGATVPLQLSNHHHLRSGKGNEPLPDG